MFLLSVTEYFVITLSVLTIYFFVKKRELSRPPVFNVYRKPDIYYYIKLFCAWTLHAVRKFSGNKQDLTPFEKPQVLKDDEKGVDAVYFNGSNKQGDYFMCGMARRPNKLIDGFLYLQLDYTDFGVMGNIKLPDTTLVQSNDEEGYAAEGISIKNIIPMKEWKIHFKGDLKTIKENSQTLPVELNLTFTSNLPHFDFNTDMDSLCTARAMALEKWSREYFDTLKAVHQNHYEQPGILEGAAIVDGKSYSVKLDCVRDRTVGSREWRHFHRYIIHYCGLENGDRFMVGIISTPISFSCIYIGYIYVAKDKKMFPVQSCDLQLYQHGERGEPSEDYAFSFTAGNKTYVVKVDINDLPAFYISKEWECKVYEGLCVYNVNGVEGWGGAEWEYRNIEGRNVR